MLTWAFLWFLVRAEMQTRVGLIVPMFCDVAIFFFVACACLGWP